MQVFKKVELVKKTYDKFLSDFAKKNDLTLNELKILIFLKGNENNIAKDLVHGLCATKSHISMSLTELEKNGYIIKVQEENDKKKSSLKLTEKSFRIIDEASEVQDDVKSIMTQGITKEEINELNVILKKIEENLESYNKNLV